MLKTNPRNARAKRAMDHREPKLIENTKQALFIPGSNCNQVLQDAMVDLNSLKKPDSKKFQRRNDVRPFEDASSIEFFSEKNDSSLLVLANHNKKRPNNLTFIRTFNYKVFDMIELRLDNYKFLKDFRKATFQVGLKPMFTFNGPAFSTHPVFQHVKSLFLDFFRGQLLDGLDVAGLQHVISISADEVDEEKPLPKVHMRVYMLKTYRSNDNPKLPRVELDEIGPRFDFTIGRRQEASPDVAKEAFKVAKQLEPKTKKNIEVDPLGDKLGRVHVDRQDLNQLQSRKMKGLKKRAAVDSDDEDDDEMASGDDEEMIDVSTKKARKD